MTRLLARLALVLLLLGLGPLAHAEDDHVMRREVLEDPTGTLRIDEVVQRPFSPLGPLLTRGYSASTFWLRLTVRPPASGDALVLRLRPTYLDQVELFEASASAPPSAWRHRLTGDQIPFSQRDRHTVALGFEIRPQPTRADGLAVYYLRVHSTSTVMLAARALPPEEARQRDVRMDQFIWLYLSLMAAMILWATQDYALNPQPLTRWFLATQTVYVLFALSLPGYMAVLLPDDWSPMADTLTSVTVCLSTFVNTGFHLALWRAYAPSRGAIRAAHGVMALLPLQLLAIALDHPRLAVQSNALAALFGNPCLLGWMALSARLDGVPRLRTLRGLAALQTLIGLAAMLPILGWIEAVDWNLQSSLLFGMMSALLMGLTLTIQSRHMHRERRATALHLARVEASLDSERAQREDQRQFLGMLAHELKTPLMTIRLATQALTRMPLPQEPMVQGRLRNITLSTEAMNAVVDRVLQAERLTDGRLQTLPATFALDDLLRELQAAVSDPARIALAGPVDAVLHTDRDLLRVILHNLLDNACKYSPDHSTVEVAVAPRDDAHLTLSVRNQIGRAGAPDASQLFRKYYRSEQALNTSGAGLGMWLAHNLASRLGGELTMQSHHDQVVFTLTLPR